MRDEHLRALDVDGGHVLAHACRHDEGRVVAGDTGEKPGQQVVGQLARRQRQAEPDHVLQLGQAADDEVAVGVVRLGCLAVAGRAVIDEVGGDGAGRPAGAHVEQKVADDEGLLRRRAHRRGGVQHAVRRRFGRDVAVVAGNDDVEIVHRERGEAAQRPLDRAQPVACQHADGEALAPEPPHELFSALVGCGGVGGGQLEALQRERGGVARLTGRQRQDPLEDELVRRAADLALDGGEVERAGVSERAVEVEEDGPKPERPCGAHAGTPARAITRRRP